MLLSMPASTVAGEAYDIDDAPPGAAWESATTFSSVASTSLAELARPLLKDSINLYGEAVLRLSARRGVFPTNDAALAGLRETLERWGIRTDAWQIVDGSGLSRRNAVAPEVLVAVLRRMYDPAANSPWMNAMPLAGRDGTLADRMRGTAAEANVRAKTGTMSNIRTLAGYVRTRDNETLAFAIMADNFEGTGSTAVEAIDRIAVRLAEIQPKSLRHPTCVVVSAFRRTVGPVPPRLVVSAVHQLPRGRSNLPRRRVKSAALSQVGPATSASPEPLSQLSQEDLRLHRDAR